MPSPDPAALPLVSVLIPSFNHEQFVEEAIQSVLDQTYPNVELIVVDDCSTDGTAEAVERLAERHGFQFSRNERNSGVNSTLEAAIELSAGAYISVLASDDKILPDKLERQIEYLLKHDLDAVYGTAIILLEDGAATPIDMPDVDEEFRNGSILNQLYTDSSNAPLLQSALIKRECVLELQGERKRFASDDWVMLIRLVERYRVGFVNRPQFYYRQHGSNTYQNYWGTMPMRVEVISLVTPERLRPVALANMFRDQAQFLYMDGKTGMAFKFLFASMALKPSLRSWGGLIAELSGRVAKRSLRRIGLGRKA